MRGRARLSVVIGGICCWGTARSFLFPCLSFGRGRDVATGFDCPFRLMVLLGGGVSSPLPLRSRAMLLFADDEGVSGRDLSENHDCRFPIACACFVRGFANLRADRPPWTLYKMSTCCMKPTCLLAMPCGYLAWRG